MLKGPNIPCFTWLTANLQKSQQCVLVSVLFALASFPYALIWDLTGLIYLHFITEAGTELPQHIAPLSDILHFLSAVCCYSRTNFINISFMKATSWAALGQSKSWDILWKVSCYNIKAADSTFAQSDFQTSFFFFFNCNVILIVVVTNFQCLGEALKLGINSQMNMFCSLVPKWTQMRLKLICF